MAFTAISTARASEPTVQRRIGGDAARNGTFPGGVSTGASEAFVGDLFDFKEDLVTAGWRIYGSGDGLAAYELTGATGGAGAGVGGAYDVITTYTLGAGGFNTSNGAGHWWIWFQSPADAAVQRFFCLCGHGDSAAASSASVLRIFVSFAPPTGGAANEKPIASDEACILGEAGPSLVAVNTDGRAFSPSSGGTGHSTSWIIGDKDEEYSFIFFTQRLGTTEDDVHGVFAYDQCVGVHPTDPDPHYWIATAPTGTGNSVSIFNARSTADGLWDAGTGTSGAAMQDFSAGTNRVARVSSSQYDGDGNYLGHFQGIYFVPEDNDGTFLGLRDGRRFQAFLSPASDFAHNWAWIAGAYGSQRYFKGRPRGRLIQHIGSYAGDNPRIIELGGARHVVLGYLVLPWHPTEWVTTVV